MQVYYESEILIFRVYFFNMDISLIASICVKTFMCVAEIC